MEGSNVTSEPAFRNAIVAPAVVCFRILMPKFFMHLRTSSGLLRDEQGQELENLDEAHREATDALRLIVAIDPFCFPDTCYEIESEDGQLRMLVAAREANPEA